MSQHDLELLRNAYHSTPQWARSYNSGAFEKHHEYLQLVAARDVDYLYQLTFATAIKADLDGLLRFLHDLCRDSDFQIFLPTCILMDSERFDTILDAVLQNRVLRRRARALRGEEAAGLMNNLIERLRQRTANTPRPQILRLLQDISEASGSLPPVLFLNEVIRDRKMGGGGEADIWLGEFRGLRVVLRDVRLPEGDTLGRDVTMKHIRREVLSICTLVHTNILPFFGVWFDSTHPLSIVNAFAENGTAREFLARNAGSLLHIAQGVVSAVQFLHDLNPPIVHGDIRGSNVLISSEGQALLSDFGLCKLRHEVTRTLSRNGDVKEGGSSRYLAPEILNGDIIKWTPESDRYSLAMTFLELAILDRPFSEISNEYAVIIAVGQGRHPQRPPALHNLETEKADMFWELLESMWDHNPAQRLPLPQVRTRLDALCLPSVTTAPSRLDAMAIPPQTDTRQLGSYFTTPANELAPLSRREKKAPFVCPVEGCGLSFTRSFQLKGHLRSHHVSMAWMR